MDFYGTCFLCRWTKIWLKMLEKAQLSMCVRKKNSEKSSSRQLNILIWQTCVLLLWLFALQLIWVLGAKTKDLKTAKKFKKPIGTSVFKLPEQKETIEKCCKATEASNLLEKSANLEVFDNWGNLEPPMRELTT